MKTITLGLLLVSMSSLAEPITFDSIQHNGQSAFTRRMLNATVTADLDDDNNFTMTYQTAEGPRTLSGKAVKLNVTGEPDFCRPVYHIVINNPTERLLVTYSFLPPVSWCIRQFKKEDVESIFVASFSGRGRNFDSASTLIEHTKPFSWYNFWQK